MKVLKSFALFLIISATLLDTVTCISKWYDASDGRKYLLETELKYNWYQAWHECARRDSQLVIIDSESKNIALIELLKKVIVKVKRLTMKVLKSFALFLIISATLLDTVTCISKWYDASDGRKYLLETELKYNWYQAWHECARRDSQLVIIDSESKNIALIELLKKVIGQPQSLWLGGNDEYNMNVDTKRPFYWSPKGQTFSYTFWSKSQPDNLNKGQHCVAIFNKVPTYEWDDAACTDKYGYICEENHFWTTYKKDLNEKRKAIQQTNKEISQHYAVTQYQLMGEINSTLQDIERVENDFNRAINYVQNRTQNAILKILREQEMSIKLLNDEKSKRIAEYSLQLKKSTEDLNNTFSNNLNVKQYEIDKILEL